MEPIALVTGASRGIGAAIFDRLHKLGFAVYGTATSAEGAAKIEKRVEGHGLVMDVTDSDSIKDALADLKARAGGDPLVLVNNAGITRDQLLLRMRDDDWDTVLDANLRGVFALTRAALRPMVKARFGRIIQVSSVVGLTGNPGQTNYAASKAGAIGFSKSLAQEIGARGITVNVVAPGFIDTDMTRALSDEQQAALLAKIPLGRLGSTGDVAAAVAFLASEEAGYITGETIHVNGGMYMS